MSLTIEKLNPSNKNYSDCLDWISEQYIRAIEEESHFTAGVSRKVDPNGKWQVKQALSQILSAPHQAFMLLASHAEIKVGYFLGLIKYCVAEIPSQIAYVNGLYVIPEYRKQQIATQLVLSGYEEFRKMNLSVVELYITTKNEAAKAFWKKLGYQRTEEVFINSI